jgi:hypothetical protein
MKFAKKMKHIKCSTKHPRTFLSSRVFKKTIFNKGFIFLIFLIGCSHLELEVSQPHFEGSVRSSLTLSKMGLESPLGLPKTQNSIARVKTPRLEVFLIPLERS